MIWIYAPKGAYFFFNIGKTITNNGQLTIKEVLPTAKPIIYIEQIKKDYKLTMNTGRFEL